MDRSLDRRTYAAFVTTVLIGGTNFIGVRYSNLELPPLYGATLRFGLAALLLFAIVRFARIPTASRSETAGAALYGIFGFGLAYAALYYALVGLPAGTAAVVMAAAPLFTLIIAVLLGQEQMTVRALGAAVLAIGGIGILSAETLDTDIALSYLLAATCGSIAAAASTVVAKSLQSIHPLRMNAIGMAAGTVLLAATSITFREPWTVPVEPRTWFALAWLVVLGSTALFQLFLFVVRRWTASATVYALACMPVVAVALGAILLGEPITRWVVAGAGLVMAAVYIGAIGGGSASAANELAERPESLTFH